MPPFCVTVCECGMNWSSGSRSGGRWPAPSCPTTTPFFIDSSRPHHYGTQHLIFSYFCLLRDFACFCPHPYSLRGESFRTVSRVFARSKLHLQTTCSWRGTVLRFSPKYVGEPESGAGPDSGARQLQPRARKPIEPFSLIKNFNELLCGLFYDTFRDKTLYLSHEFLHMYLVLEKLQFLVEKYLYDLFSYLEQHFPLSSDQSIESCFHGVGKVPRGNLEYGKAHTDGVRYR